MEFDFVEYAQRYSGNIPRYTSFPTAVNFRNFRAEESPEDLLRSSLQQIENISLYVHLPYCPRLCYFCACNKIISKVPGKNGEYLSYLEKEVGILNSVLGGGEKALQLHLGGGSPSYLTAEEHLQLHKILSSFNLKEGCDKSIEVDPRTTDGDKIQVLADLGFRRFSLGIQDFDPGVQRNINRVQSFDSVGELVGTIRNYPETSINFDLIYGLPGQTPDSIRKTIEKVVVLRPERIALYGYAHVVWRNKVQKKLNRYGIPDSLERAALFAEAAGQLEGAGYESLGLDHFVLPSDELYRAAKLGKLRRNFMGYTTVAGDCLIGCGVSAISDVGTALIQNAPDLKDYEKHLNGGRLPAVKVVKRSEGDQVRAYIIERIMCDAKVSVSQVAERFPTFDVTPVFAAAEKKLRIFEDDNIVNLSANQISVTRPGRYFLRWIATAFDNYLEAQDSSRLYSAA